MSSVGSTTVNQSRAPACVRGVVLASAFLLMLPGAWTNSATSLERSLLPSGLAAWGRHSLGIYRVCGPVAKFVYALPAYVAGVRVDYPEAHDRELRGRVEWDLSDLFENETAQRYLEIYRWSRLFPILVALLGGWLIGEWSTRLFGEWAGVGSVCVWCWTPLVLGHGSLVTSDVISATALLIAARTFWSFLLNPRPATAGLAGLALGLAAATKFTLLALYPCWGLLVLPRIVARQASTTVARRLRILGLATGLVVVSLVVLDALYLFQEVGVKPTDWNLEASSVFGSIAGLRGRPETAWLFQIPTPVPMELLRGLDVQLADTERLQTGYLFGELRMGGWWYWYSVAAMIKLPIPVIVLFVLAIVRLPKSLGNDDPRFWAAWCILLPALETAFAIAASTGTGSNAAFRYMIPSLALMCVWTGSVWESPSRILRLVATALVGWTALNGLAGLPDPFAWQNEVGWAWERAVGKPALIGDAVDWGQDLQRLSDWVARHAREGSTMVEVYGMGRGDSYRLVAPAAKPASDAWSESAYLAVSKNLLFGYASRAVLRVSDGRYGMSREMAAELSRRRPFDRVGRSILIYRIADLERDGFPIPDKRPE